MLLQEEEEGEAAKVSGSPRCILGFNKPTSLSRLLPWDSGSGPKGGAERAPFPARRGRREPLTGLGCLGWCFFEAEQFAPRQAERQPGMERLSKSFIHLSQRD